MQPIEDLPGERRLIGPYAKPILPALLFFAALAAVQATAQSPSAESQQSASGLSDSSPLDIPYGIPVSFPQARTALQAAEAEAARRGWPEAIAVTGPDGRLVAFAKMDDMQNASLDIAIRKASTAARFRRDTRIFYNAFEGGHSAVGTLDPGMGDYAKGLSVYR